MKFVTVAFTIVSFNCFSSFCCYFDGHFILKGWKRSCTSTISFYVNKNLSSLREAVQLLSFKMKLSAFTLLISKNFFFLLLITFWLKYTEQCVWSVSKWHFFVLQVNFCFWTLVNFMQAVADEGRRALRRLNKPIQGTPQQCMCESECVFSFIFFHLGLSVQTL